MNEKKKSLILLGAIGIFILLIIVGIIIDNINSKKVLDNFLKYYNSSEQTMVLLGKEGCSYCQAFKPELDFMSEYYGFEYKYIDVSKLNSAHYNKLLETLGINSDDFGTPYTVVVQGGKKIDELSGAVEESELLQFLKDNKIVSEDKKLLINYVDYSGYDKVLKSENASIIGIGKTTCIYCKMVKSTLNKLIKENNITINYLNLDLLTEDELSSLYSSLEFFNSEEWGTPTFLIVQNGKLLGTIQGAQSEEAFISEFTKYGLMGE